METIFYLSLAIILYTYLVYPVIISGISLFFPLKYSEQDTKKASISILIAAYNEEKVIAERIQNIAELECDFSRIEVLVGSDSSSDATDSILSEISQKFEWLRPYYFSERRGKAEVLNDLVAVSCGEILVFTDANTHFEPHTLARLIEDFCDSRVGGVSGRLILVPPFTSPNIGREEAAYWNYETMIKKAEGRCGILIGANGAIFAIRRKFFRPLPHLAITDDLYLSLSVLLLGGKFLYRSDAVAIEETARTEKAEFDRKVRYAATNYQTLLQFWGLLFNVQRPLASFAFLSHKIIRWFVPHLLLLALCVNFVLLDNPLLRLLLVVQCSFYGIAGIGGLLSQFFTLPTFLVLPWKFVSTNYALMVGFFRYLLGRHSVIWQSTLRT